MKPITKPVIAAWFEAEGHVSKPLRGHSYGRISITQKDPRVLRDIQRIYGGFIRTFRNGDCHRLVIASGAGVDRFRREIEPHCRYYSSKFHKLDEPTN
jgi:hypothetical protein